ncbi:hypothetical protein J3R82DRAFT_1842 [Butyriboletus roseoflavus]|nr:hypothetical protein J3R82DRAFT_1842 [Butyriboletus roseoflavus]
MPVDDENKLTERDLEAYEEIQKNQCEEQDGKLAVSIARLKSMISDSQTTWCCQSTGVNIISGDNYKNLENWQALMATNAIDLNSGEDEHYHDNNSSMGDNGTVAGIDGMNIDQQDGSRQHNEVVEALVNPDAVIEDHITPTDVQNLLRDQ